MSIIVRVVLRLFLRTRVGALILGILLIVIGLIVGASSSQVSYIQSTDGATYEIATGQQSGNVYFNVKGSNEYYVAFSSDFTIPKSVLDTPGTLSFIARSDTSTLDPALNGPNGTVNDAHKIEKLVLKDNNGSVIGTYTTDEYTANPNGVYVNNWPAGGISIGLGVLLTVLGVWIYLKRKPQALPAAPVGGFQQPVNAQPMANPYAQPVANPYAQPVANPYAQPGANPYEQQPVANPYAQPYQGPASVNQPGANPYAGNQYPPQYPQAPQQ